MDSASVASSTPLTNHRNAEQVLPATHYADLGDMTRRAGKTWRTSLKDLKPNFDPLAEVTITPQQKSFALSRREQNRAFNGAPPTIPHPADQMSAQSCLACHGEGVKSETLRISKMSHQFLTNCTQCHVENSRQPKPAELFRENSFVGLPAPTGGPRAYEGAPPMIPHSTWMRVDCMSCHGFAGQQGIRTTHPWRQNCQQCHAASSALEQTPLNSEPSFLAPPIVEK
jgi:cytochrome c-type protein NapB